VRQTPLRAKSIHECSRLNHRRGSAPCRAPVLRRVSCGTGQEPEGTEGIPLAEAIEDYAAALRLDPHNADAFNNRGNAYSNKGDYRRARADYEKALQLDPNNTVARNNLEVLAE
jgi:tetratricopeptide (TPR) repeat protein